MLRTTPHLLLLAALITSIPAVAQQPEGVVTTGTVSYRLRPGDVLMIRVWGREEFSGQFQVDENWTIQYPVLGEFTVRDLTVGDVRDQVRQGLETLFRSPFVTVTPLFRMAVLGHVRNPGLYTVDPTLSVIDVVALAGGPASGGNMSRIRLLRGGSETEIDFAQASLRGRTLAEVGVRSGDEIIVPRKWFTREDVLLLLGFTQVLLSIAIFFNTI
ncbi:MAG TPA: polysaccharide biosynthesis/export family protein [Gemmatimonadales bacterium]